MIKASLIISVYNKYRELDLILESLKFQNESDFECIVSEDGESKSISDTVKKHLKALKIKHITQADKGFRKTAILNKSIKVSESEQLIFIDGDCIPHYKFIEAHTNKFNEYQVRTGRRVLMGKRISSSISLNNIKSLVTGKINSKLILDSVTNKDNGTKHAEEILLPSFNKKRKDTLLGSNFSASKKLLCKINGFDENYTGAGLGEDADIDHRLQLAGAEFISVRNKAIVYHLYHDKTIESSESMDYYKKVISSGDFRCKNGIDKL